MPANDLPAKIAEARNGSPEALGQLLETCRQYLLLIANRELFADLRGKVGASDLVQETFLKAQAEFDRFHGHDEQELLAWLRCILLNTAANCVRQYCGTDMRQLSREVTWEQVPFLCNGLVDRKAAPDVQAAADEQNARLQRALGGLPNHYRQVVIWRNWDRRSFEEIGRRLGKSPEAARKLWARALDQLGQYLEA